MTIDQGKSRIRNEPASVGRQDTLAISLAFRAGVATQLGKMQEARNLFAEMWSIYTVREPSPYQSGNLLLFALSDAGLSAETGNAHELDRARRRIRQYAKMKQAASAGDSTWWGLLADFHELRILHIAGDVQATPAAVAQLVGRADKLRGDAIAKKLSSTEIQSQSECWLKCWRFRLRWPTQMSNTRWRTWPVNVRSSWSAARASGTHLAPQMNWPGLNMQTRCPSWGRRRKRTCRSTRRSRSRAQLKAGSDDRMLRIELAGALWVAAQLTPGKRAANLKEASALLAGLPAEVMALRSARLAREQVDAALR